MVAVRFIVGERVRLRTAIPVACAGTVGTIQLVYRSVEDTYDVRFDGGAWPQLLLVHQLERVAAVPEAA